MVDVPTDFCACAVHLTTWMEVTSAFIFSKTSANFLSIKGRHIPGAYLMNMILKALAFFMSLQLVFKWLSENLVYDWKSCSAITIASGYSQENSSQNVFSLSWASAHGSVLHRFMSLVLNDLYARSMPFNILIKEAP